MQKEILCTFKGSNKWSMHVLLINGPNLNLLGIREPHLYGHRSFDDFLEELCADFPQHTLAYFQSNHEGALIDRLQAARQESAGVVINAGAYSHTSQALADAVTACNLPAVEVHISNVFKREAFRHHSYLSAVCIGTITGLGMEGYRLALLFLDRHLR